MVLRVLMLEPFGGGSHAAFCRGWQASSRHALTLLELPAVHWKWRSRHSSFTLAEAAVKLVAEGAAFDIVVASDMLNLAEWRGFVGPPLSELPTVVYFHENQFTYPLAAGHHRDYHFAYTNILNAIAATEVWFNSAFHRAEFATAAMAWLRRMPDYRHLESLERALARAKVMHPGITVPQTKVEVPGCGGKLAAARPRTIGWVSRWEHDKRPERFVAAVEALLADVLPFQLILLGQQFQQLPASLQHLLHAAQPHIRHCGYAPTPPAYWAWLAEMDLVVSTADHEFFGIGIVEAMAAGALPVLPNQLAYPEVLDIENFPAREKYLYDGSVAGLVSRLQAWLSAESLDRDPSLRASMERFYWPQVARQNDAGLAAIVREPQP